MSFPILDYLPCDLVRYSQEVLPAWQAARQGRLQPLRELIASARHFSYWPVFNLPNPLPDLFFAGPKSCFGWDYFKKDQSFWPQFFDKCRFVPPLPLPPPGTVEVDDFDFWRRYYSPALRETLPQEFFSTHELDFWALCSRHLPALFGQDASPKPQVFLLGCLFYTFCCQLPSEAMVDCRVIGNEDVGLWEEYLARSEQTRALWRRFREPAPQPLADQLLAPQTYQEYLASLDQDRMRHVQRALIDIGHDIMGFLDHEETASLLASYPTQERPDLDSVIYGCIRDREGKQWSLSPDLEQLWERTYYRQPAHDPEKFALFRHDPAAFREYMKHYIELQRHHYEAFLRTRIQDTRQILEIYRAMCAYWNEAYPQEFQENANRYYQRIEQMETEIMSRFQYAAERGWGMVELRA